MSSSVLPAILAAVMAFALIIVVLLTYHIESNPNHMTYHEKNACIKRIEEKVDVILDLMKEVGR